MVKKRDADLASDDSDLTDDHGDLRKGKLRRRPEVQCCVLALLTVGFPVLLQLNVIVFCSIFYCFKLAFKSVFFTQRHLKSCLKINLYRLRCLKHRADTAWRICENE